MKVFLFGTGIYYMRYKPFFDNVDIAGLIDNDKNKIGKFVDGIEIYSPAEAIKKRADAFFILTNCKNFNDIYAQLIALGVPKDLIYNVNQIVSFLGDRITEKKMTVYCTQKQYVTLRETRRKQIALIGNDLSRTGGPISLLKVARILKKYHYDVYYISMEDGYMRDVFVSNDIPVVIDPNMHIRSFSELQWLHTFDLIFLNGIHCYKLLLNGQPDNQVIWWLHDPPMYYDGYQVDKLDSLVHSHVSVYAVSDLAKKPFNHYCPSWGNIGSLMYGVYDIYKPELIAHEKLIFAIIGTISTIKGHEVLLRAIEQINVEKMNNCEFWIVGNINSSFAKKIIDEASKISNLKFLGEMFGNALEKVYQTIDVLVCPSLQDVMPTVCTEAMMYHHPCIVSDQTGTAQYIVPRKNGLVFKSGDVKDLAKKLEWMIKNRHLLAEMGKCAREIYEKHFSMENFERELLKIVKDKLEK